MPKGWTGDLVGVMHVKRITKKELADRLKLTPEYVSMVINGHREPLNAEEKFMSAVEEIIKEKDAS